MKKFSLHLMPVALVLVFSVLLVSCGGSGAAVGGDPATTNGGTTTPGGGTTTPAAGNLSGTVQPDAADSSASGKNANATVYVVGQQSSAVKTDSSGNFTLNMDVSLSGTVLSSPSWFASLFKAASTTKSFGLVVLSEGSTHGKKTEITVTDGKVDPVSTIYVNAVGTITGKAFLQGQTDHTGIRVYIPGTSFQATTDANGNYNMTGVPAGTYDIVRADYPGTVYHYAVSTKVVVASASSTTLPDMLLQTSVGANGSILINKGAVYATSAGVDIAVAPSPDAVLMQISDDVNFTGMTWENVKPIKQLTLTGDFSAGKNATVYAKFADMSGLASSPVSASIYVDTNPLAVFVGPVTNTGTTKPALKFKYPHAMPGIKYMARIGTNNDCTSSALEQSATAFAGAGDTDNSGQYVVQNALTNGTPYYWCAAIVDGSGKQWSWAGPWTFTVTLGSADPVSPVNGSLISLRQPTFTWNQSLNTTITGYDVALSSNGGTAEHCTVTNSACSGGVCSVGLSLANGCTVDMLASTPSTTYDWTVTPIDENTRSGVTSGTQRFLLDSAAPTGVSVSIDDGNSITTSTTVTITLEANDNNLLSSNGVAAWYAVESVGVPAAPSAGAVGWVPVSSTNTFAAKVQYPMPLTSTNGNKTIYVWYKDKAGNVSNDASATIKMIGFSIETIFDNTFIIDEQIGLALGSNDVLHAVYPINSSSGFKYQYVSSTTSTSLWTNLHDLATLGSNYGVGNHRTSIALDAGNNAYISYIDPNVNNAAYVVLSSAGSWGTPQLYPGGGINIGGWNDIAVGSGNSVHMIFKIGNSSTNLPYWSPGAVVNTVTTSSQAGSWGMAIAADSTSTDAFVAYTNMNTGGGLLVAKYNGGWSYGSIDQTTTSISYPDMLLDGAGSLHVAYVATAGPTTVKYATASKTDITSWSTATAAAVSAGCGQISIARDSSGYIHISYVDGSKLMYATNAYGGWSSANVAPSASFTALAVDNSGKVYILYYVRKTSCSGWPEMCTDTNGTLKMARMN